MTATENWLLERACIALSHGKRVEILTSKSGREWAAYAIGADGKCDVRVSPVFSADVGQTVDDCIQGCRRNFGIWLHHRFAQTPKLPPQAEGGR